MSDETPVTTCGFVAVIGQPNAGKSTLINGLVGQKIAITSHKVHTTRMRALGIALHEEAQIIFIDTPGIFAPKKDFDKAMVQAAWDSIDQADIILHLVDASLLKKARAQMQIIQRLPEDKKVFLVLNKIDKIKKEELLALTASLNEDFSYDQTFMISALKDEGTNALKATLAEKLPAGPWHYDEEVITDLPMRLLAAEITREKIYNQLHKELPYAIHVETEEWTEFDNGDIKINQLIYVERDSQKAIVLGKGGQQIKKIGEQSRLELQDILERKIHLKIFVKVQENWSDNPEILSAMGLK